MAAELAPLGEREAGCWPKTSRTRVSAPHGRYRFLLGFLESERDAEETSGLEGFVSALESDLDSVFESVFESDFDPDLVSDLVSDFELSLLSDLSMPPSLAGRDDPLLE